MNTQNHDSHGQPTGLRLPPMPHIVLPEAIRETLLLKAMQHIAPNGRVSAEELLRYAYGMADSLTFLTPFLRELHEPNGVDYVVISNLPTDPQLPPPPSNGVRPSRKRTLISEQVLVAIAMVAGLQVLSYVQERGDAIVHEVAPSDTKAQTASSLGRETLGFHTDAAVLHRDYRPDVLLLLGLENS